MPEDRVVAPLHSSYNYNDTLDGCMCSRSRAWNYSPRCLYMHSQAAIHETKKKGVYGCAQSEKGSSRVLFGQISARTPTAGGAWYIAAREISRYFRLLRSPRGDWWYLRERLQAGVGSLKCTRAAVCGRHATNFYRRVMRALAGFIIGLRNCGCALACRSLLIFAAIDVQVNVSSGISKRSASNDD